MYNRRFPFHHTPASGKRLDFIRIMIAIIAEKPSVGQDIARVVGATEKKDGYIVGNGYMVTWALGHLVSLALPDAYGYTRTAAEDLPMIPDPFRLVVRQVRTDRGMVTDIAAGRQLKVIGEVLAGCESIIVATDAGREGELIFRYLYEYIGCATPFDRLWISSLTDKAIREGLERIESGAKYDNLYYAAKARSEADWLVGINATQAITIAAGRGTYSLGRVQTPTLAMVCERYLENKRFTPETIWQAHFATPGAEADAVVKFSSAEKWKEKAPAEAAYRSLKAKGAATVTNVERKETVQEPPLLYDLTTLQKEANTKHGFSADKTLSIAQKLYEAKAITYPRTGSRYIPEDVFAQIPALLLTLKNNPAWSRRLALLGETPTRRSVDDGKVTDHHALLPTDVRPKLLSADEQTVYDMIVGRMLEAFSEPCIKDVTTVTATCDGVAYTTKGAIVRQAGWRGIYGEETEDTVLPEWTEGTTLAVGGCSLTEGKTKPKPLHTEASLLAAMETCGKEIENEELRQSLKACGIGTPATRAAIIETLFSREYMVRQKKSLVPTEKGLALYSVVRQMRIADVEMTGEWEAALAKIERGELRAEAFRGQIERYTTEITSELLTSEKLFTHKGSDCICPKCKTGQMQFFGKVVRCDNAACGLPVFRIKAGKTLSDAEITELLTKGRTGVIRGFNSKQGKAFSAIVAFDADFNTVFEFPETKNEQRKPKRKK